MCLVIIFSPAILLWQYSFTKSGEGVHGGTLHYPDDGLLGGTCVSNWFSNCIFKQDTGAYAELEVSSTHITVCGDAGKIRLDLNRA